MKRLFVPGILILVGVACRPGPKDTASPDSGAPGDSQDSQDSQDSGPDSGDDCVSYAEIVAQCAALVSPGDRVEGYESIDASSPELLADLHSLVSATHSGVSYDHLWDAFLLTDARPDGAVWDLYSDWGDGTSEYSYTFIEDQCGEYSREGDCYNREHIFAQDWSEDASPMKTDLNHVFPTDGWVNNIRGNLLFGPVSRADTVTGNGSKRGDSALCDYRYDLFEPIDAYKGDIARAVLYMHVRYAGQDSGWGGSGGTDGAELEPWFQSVLLGWHIQDPVSDKERARNDAVESVQGNRNPFIDHPEYACGSI